MSELGIIKISDEVVKVLASTAATEVEGVFKLAGGVVDEVSKMLGKKSLTNGIKVEVGEKECNIEIYIVVDYGYVIPDVAKAVQKNVIEKVSKLSGLQVVEVNIYVQSVKLEKDKEEEEKEKYFDEMA